jgi:hypothetical protein
MHSVRRANLASKDLSKEVLKFTKALVLLKDALEVSCN